MSVSYLSNKLKFIIVGETQVGKTALLSRLATDQFMPHTMPTVGLEFKSKKEELAGKFWNVELWDTTGQERYRKIVSQFFRGIHGAFIVFDLTNEKTLDQLGYWMQEIDANVAEDVPKVLLGNKYDLIQNEGVEVSMQQKIDKAVRKHNLTYYEASVKTGMNIQLAYGFLLMASVNRLKGKAEVKDSVMLRQKDQKAKSKIKESKEECC